MLHTKFRIGDSIKLPEWESEYFLKIIDIGTIYFIVEQMDATIGWREIKSDWQLIKP